MDNLYVPVSNIYEAHNNGQKLCILGVMKLNFGKTNLFMGRQVKRVKGVI